MNLSFGFNLQVSFRARVKGLAPPVSQPLLSNVWMKYRMVLAKNSDRDLEQRMNPLATEEPRIGKPMKTIGFRAICGNKLASL